MVFAPFDPEREEEKKRVLLLQADTTGQSADMPRRIDPSTFETSFTRPALYSVLALISFTLPLTRWPAAFMLPLARSAIAFTLFPLASSI